jgi:hypothetical protein
VETNIQCTDPAVSRLKYFKELETFQALRDDWRNKGVFLVHADFPVMEFLFTAPKLKPSSVVFAIRIDFTNFDTEPLSVRCIDPFNRNVITRREVPIHFILAIQKIVNGQVQFQQQDLLQGPADEIPFFCFKGTREYHENPAHTGDSWFLYRGNSGIGTLNHILDTLYNYGLLPVGGYNVNLQPQITFQQQFKAQV